MPNPEKLSRDRLARTAPNNPVLSLLRLGEDMCCVVLRKNVCCPVLRKIMCCLVLEKIMFLVLRKIMFLFLRKSLVWDWSEGE